MERCNTCPLASNLTGLSWHHRKEAHKLISLDRPRTWKKMACGKAFQNGKYESWGETWFLGTWKLLRTRLILGTLTWRGDLFIYVFIHIFTAPCPLPKKIHSEWENPSGWGGYSQSGLGSVLHLWSCEVVYMQLHVCSSRVTVAMGANLPVFLTVSSIVAHLGH